MLRVVSNSTAFLKAVAKTADKLVVAQAMALTSTAKDLEKSSNQRAEAAFDRPVAFTKRSAAIKPATRAKLISTVFIKDIQAAYLEKQEEGGRRQPKKRYIPVPSAARLDRFGNMPKGYVSAAVARRDVFQGTVNGVTGVWERKGRKLSLLINYATDADYNPRFNWRKTMAVNAVRYFPTNYEKALARLFK